MLIKNGLVFTENNEFLPLDIRTDNDRITSLTEPNSSTTLSDSAKGSSDATCCTEKVVDATGCYVIPGLTDIHFHGCDGYDLCDNSLDACQAIAKFCLKQGVTSICPATMTLPADELTNICKTVADFHAYQQTTACSTQADFIGIHLEGPFINAEKRGAQNKSYIQNPAPSLIRQWLHASDGLVKLISLAPELPDALTCIHDLKDRVSFSIGHTNADYTTAKAAMDAGALHVTHLFNAMPPFHHRDTGVVGAAFDTEDCYAELICDGIHVSAPAVRAVFKLFENRVILISDSMRATGKPDGTYTLGGQPVTVTGKQALLSDGTLAGSVTPLFDCLKTAVSMGIPLETAVAAATIHPCRSIGVDHLYGSITPGKKAHLLLLNKHTLEIKAILKGEGTFLPT